MNKTGRSSIYYGYIVVVAGVFIAAVAYGTFYTFGVFLKPMTAEFGWSRAIISGAYSLAVALVGIFSVVLGRLNDKYGPRIITTVCGFLFGLGYLLMSQITAIWQLYIIYGVMVAAGIMVAWVPLLSTVARWFARRRGLMTGVVVSGIGLGTIIMSSLAEWLISAYGWRHAYIIMGTVILVVFITAAQFLRRDPSQKGLVPYGINKAVEKAAYLEAREFSLRQALSNRQFWMLFAVFCSFGFCIDAIIVHIVPHVTEFGISATIAANILAVIGAVSIIGRLVLGGAGDRIGNKRACIVGFIIMMVALAWLQLAKEAWTFYLFVIVYGFAYGGLVTLMSPMVAELFGLGSHGAIMGIVTFAMTIGESIGPLMAGRIFDVTGGYQLAFLIFAILAIIGLVSTLLLKPVINEGSV
ncbi:MFS transporter [Chloroflexota bacterium]